MSFVLIKVGIKITFFKRNCYHLLGHFKFGKADADVENLVNEMLIKQLLIVSIVLSGIFPRQKKSPKPSLFSLPKLSPKYITLAL